MDNSAHLITIKPFLRWAGGKRNSIKHIAAFLPVPEKVNRYFEPFLGAGSVFFHTKYDLSYISDINPHLINAFRAVRDNPEFIAKKLKYFRGKLNKQYYYKIRNKFNKETAFLTDLQAARFIFLVQTSFNGIYRVNKKGLFNVPFGKLRPHLPTRAELITASNKLKNAVLNCSDYKTILMTAKKDDFIYLDPPYPPVNGTASFNHYSTDRFSANDQAELATLASELSARGCKVLISNADIPKIRDLYSNWDSITLSAIRYISCKQERLRVNELLIRNYQY
jgi:DNA adenine methylase